MHFKRKLAAVSVIMLGLVAACKEDQVGELPTVYEAVLDVHWTNGVQTHHQMFGPLPGQGASFAPGANWYVPLAGATAHTKAFYFDLPTVRADRVVFKLIWKPRWSQARLVATPIPSRTPVVLAIFRPNDMPHPVDAPRNQSIDVTPGFNAMIERGETTVFHWEVQIDNGD